MHELDHGFGMWQGQILLCQYTATIFDGNNNVCHICHHFRDICNPNHVHALNLDLYSGTISNLNMKLERRRDGIVARGEENINVAVITPAV